MKYLLFLLLLVSCQQDRQADVKRWMESSGKVKVLSTTAMIDSLVREVGGDNVDAHTLIIGELNPHTYQLVKGDDEKFMVADIIFFNGLNLEHGPSLKKTLSEKKNAHGLGNLIYQEHPELILKIDQELDPHIWMDVSLFAETIPHIVRALSEKDPEHKADYEKRGRGLSEKLGKIHEKIKAVLQEVPLEKRYLVTSHDAFSYFARAYLAPDQMEWQERVQAPEGLAPDSQLSLLDIKSVIDHLKRFNIEVIFPETNVSQDSIRKIVDAGKDNGMTIKIAGCPLFADAMGPPGSDGDTYEKMMLHNARTIADYLQGKEEKECKVR